VLAEALGLEHYMLYAHGSDLCHDAEMRHAMANCFEALMGAIYLDSGINEADKVFSKALFGTDKVKVKMLSFALKSEFRILL
jgi:ribonuclease-3